MARAQHRNASVAWDKRSREQLADRDRWEHSAKEQPLAVRQAVAERIKAETHRIRLQVPRLRLVNAQTPMQSITEGRRDGREHAKNREMLRVESLAREQPNNHSAAALHLVPRGRPQASIVLSA